jgi:hypothetical protein
MRTSSLTSYSGLFRHHPGAGMSLKIADPRKLKQEHQVIAIFFGSQFSVLTFFQGDQTQ